MKVNIFKIMFYCIVVLLTSTTIATSQSIKGIVKDNAGDPLIGASILVKGTTKGTVSDVDGNFSIDASPGSILTVSYTGYTTKEVKIGNESNLEIVLQSGQFLDEVVITSFGIAKDKKVLGYGSQKINADEIMESGQTNIINAMQGRMAGVTINSSGGAPGAGVNINIRGINSLGGDDNQPLFVIDGIIVSNNTDVGNVRPSAGSNAVNNNEQFMNSNRMADINPDDIESMNVLKGAAATALYGQRAANGAIIITTKKGKSGKTSINYSLNYGLQEVFKTPEIQTTYYQGFTGLARTAPATVFWQFGPPALATDVFYNPNIEFFQTGVSANHSLSFSGGNEKSTFLTSVSYLNNDGISPNSNFQRITARLSATQKMTDKFSVGAQINYSNSGGINPASGDKSIFSSLSFWAPSFDINDYINPDGSQKNPFAGLIDNPRYLAEVSPQNTSVNRVFGDVNFNYDFTSWLKARYQVTLDNYTDVRDRVVRPDLDLGTQVRGYVTEQSLGFTEINSNFFLTAEKKLTNDINISATVGNNVTNITSSTLGSRGEGFVSPGFFSILNTSNQFTFKSNTLRRLVGVFADVRFDYKDYLYLNFTGRNDWSSTLPAANRSFFYPSASISYILTNSLLKDNSIFNYTKLRASLAQVGKDAPPYRIGDYFGPVSGFPFGTIGGFARDNNVGNFNLLPEITTESEIGIETNLLNNLFSLEANYFIRNSKNQILNVPISTATGYSSYTTNAGVIVNKGVELLLGINPLRGDFKWSMDLNFTRIRGVVESMPEDLKEITYVSALGGRAILRVQEGGTVGDLYGFDWNRNERGETLIGTNGLPTLNQATYVNVGNATPDWLGGLNNTFSYKGLNFAFLLEMRHGGDVVDLGENNGIRNGVLKFTEQRNQVVVWKGVLADGQPNTQQVILDENTYRAFGINAHHSYVVQDASWFRLRNINLTYSIPKSLLKNTFSNMRIGVNANNVFLSTPFRGFDPEALAFGAGSNLIGFTGRNTPATRNVNFTLNIGF
jgi:TonB-linked SusC/RagA family outer membrane protein